MVGVKGGNEEHENPGEKKRNADGQAALRCEPPHLNEVHDQVAVEREEKTARKIRRRARRAERERFDRELGKANA